jgi:hypothetical protein
MNGINVNDILKSKLVQLDKSKKKRPLLTEESLVVLHNSILENYLIFRLC